MHQNAKMAMKFAKATIVLICFVSAAYCNAQQFATFAPVSVGVSPPKQAPLSASYVPALPAYATQSGSKQHAYNEAMADVREANGGSNAAMDENHYYKSSAFTSLTQAYNAAFNDIKAMLDGKETLSVKRAYYELEAAYGNTYLSYKDFNDKIDESASFIKQWMAQHKLNTQNNEELNYAIQRFMGDTLTIINKKPDSQEPPVKVTHLPFKYDYTDFKGEQDYRNYFVTKCMATGYGQCNSMPIVYLCLAEALGAKAYLSFAPHHSLIKYADAKGYLHNYEPTSNYHITDRWYQDNLYIKAEAMKSGIYLHALNKKQIIANCMIDLAVGYMNKYGVADGQFMNDCLQTAKAAFGNSPDIYNNLTYSSLMAGLLEKTLRNDRAKGLEDTINNPQARYYFNELKKNEAHITALGYQEIPAQAYAQMMQSDSAKGRVQQANTISTKQNRNLFITTK